MLNKQIFFEPFMLLNINVFSVEIEGNTKQAISVFLFSFTLNLPDSMMS